MSTAAEPAESGREERRQDGWAGGRRRQSDLEAESTAEYASLEDVERGLARLERDFRDRRDRRAIFATAYLVITRALRRRLTEGGFQDGEWVARYAVRFGNMYRAALIAYRAGRHGGGAQRPGAWPSRPPGRHGAGAPGSAPGGQRPHQPRPGPGPGRGDNRPGPGRAVTSTTRRSTRCCGRRQTPSRTASGNCTPPCWASWTSPGAPSTRPWATSPPPKRASTPGSALWPWPTPVTSGSASTCRQGLDSQAAVLGKLILAPPLGHPWLPGALRHLEARKPWWTHLTVPATERRLAGDRRMRGGPPATAGPSPGDPGGAPPRPAGRRRSRRGRGRCPGAAPWRGGWRRATAARPAATLPLRRGRGR